MSQAKRNAALTCTFVHRLDKLGMLNRLARLKGSAPRRAALGRAIVILALSMTYSVAGANTLQTAKEAGKPAYDVMNVKLYLHNKINDWEEFECANQLGIRESNWRATAMNKESGAYGIFQHMSDYAYKWDAYTQMDKHIEYIDARYDGSWCKALDHLVRLGWH
jgi:hypothetical protein